MWTAKSADINDAIQKIRIYEDHSILTYGYVISLWRENSSFRSFYHSVLHKSPFEAFYWEYPPLTTLNTSQPYEFVLVNSPQLAGVTADPGPFEDKFSAGLTDQSVIAFENLGRDAELIVPRPAHPQCDYAHFASFLHNAPESQIHELFVVLSNSLTKRINDRATWVSTSGLGVYWLHIRLDTRPKYYSFQAYRQLTQ